MSLKEKVVVPQVAEFGDKVFLAIKGLKLQWRGISLAQHRTEEATRMRGETSSSIKLCPVTFFRTFSFYRDLDDSE